MEGKRRKSEGQTFHSVFFVILNPLLPFLDPSSVLKLSQLDKTFRQKLDRDEFWRNWYCVYYKKNPTDVSNFSSMKFHWRQLVLFMIFFENQKNSNSPEFIMNSVDSLKPKLKTWREASEMAKKMESLQLRLALNENILDQTPFCSNMLSDTFFATNLCHHVVQEYQNNITETCDLVWFLFNKNTPFPICFYWVYNLNVQVGLGVDIFSHLGIVNLERFMIHPPKKLHYISRLVVDRDHGIILHKQEKTTMITSLRETYFLALKALGLDEKEILLQDLQDYLRVCIGYLPYRDLRTGRLVNFKTDPYYYQSDAIEL